MNLKVDFKVHPVIAMLIMVAVLVLLFSLYKGCKRSRIEVAEKENAIRVADSALRVIAANKSESDSTKVEFQIKEELLEGQIALLQNQKSKDEIELDRVLTENRALIEKHKLDKYSDTAAITVPVEYTRDCENCFSKLETTSNLSLRYKNDLNKLQDKYEEQNRSHQARFKQLESEKLGFYSKIQSLAIQAKEATDKLKPHGNLYLSWGVLWSPWPTAAGAGVMYQTKYRFQYGMKIYYSNKGAIVETSMHFPLSIKF